MTEVASVGAYKDRTCDEITDDRVDLDKRAAVDDLTPNDGFRAVQALRSLADELEAEHVVQALAEGWSWAQIAEALDVTRQAVQKKHGHRIVREH